MQTLQYKKHFSPLEATRMLPYIRRVVEDIQTHGYALQKLQAKDIEEHEHHQQVERHIKAVNDLFAELEDLGCFYKAMDFEIGMVDFPGIINDEEVLLCWKSDEERITWYHSLEGGFKGRRPIPDDLIESGDV